MHLKLNLAYYALCVWVKAGQDLQKMPAEALPTEQAETVETRLLGFVPWREFKLNHLMALPKSAIPAQLAP
jgi:hypothetical protein